MRRTFSTAAFIVTALALFSAPAHAQFEALAKLAESFTDVAFQVHAIRPFDENVRSKRSPDSRRLRSVGMELLFEMRKLQTPICLANEPLCEGVRDEATVRRCHITEKPSGRTTIRKPSGVETSETVVLEESNCSPARARIDGAVELAVGFSRSSQFAVADGADLITGVFWERPSVAFYFTKYLTGADFYVGVKTGWAELDELKLSSGGTSYTATGKTVQAGLVTGLASAKVLPRLGFFDAFPPLVGFVEAGLSYRSFPGVTWSAGSTPGPTTAKTRFNLSSAWLGVGVQIHVRAKTP